MKKILCVFVFFVSSFAYSANSTAALYFADVPLSALLNFYYKNIIKQNYILSKELVSNSTPVTLNLKGVDSSKFPEIFQRLFDQYGVKNEARDGVVYLSLSSSVVSPVSTTGHVVVSNDGMVGLNSRISSESTQFSEIRPFSTHASDVSFESQNVEIYLPKNRRSSELQGLVNKFLNTNFATTDRVLLQGSEKSVSKVLSFLESYDTPSPLVKIQAYLVEFSDSTNKGQSFSMAISALGDRLGMSLGPVTALTDFFRVKSTNINAVISAVDGDSRFKLVDSPTVLCDNGELCRVQVGSETPVLGSTTFDAKGNSQQSIVYRDSGSILEVTPEITASVIRLKLRQTVSSFSKNTVSGIDSPSILKRLLESTLSVSDGEIVVMGGLEQSREDSSRSGLPFLPQWLHTKSDVKQSTQLLMILHITKQLPAR